MAGGGGAWKVAYADFVTAMMAFFMVMWLVGQKDDAKEAVASYFSDPFATGANEARAGRGAPRRSPAVGSRSEKARSRTGRARKGASQENYPPPARGRQPDIDRSLDPVCRRFCRAGSFGAGQFGTAFAGPAGQAAEDRAPRPRLAPPAAGRQRLCRRLATVVRPLPGGAAIPGSPRHRARADSPQPGRYVRAGRRQRRSRLSRPARARRSAPADRNGAGLATRGGPAPSGEAPS